MAFSSTIFKSPLIKPKLNKSVVSSSIFGSKKLTNLKPSTKPEETLIETNRILIDIQRQLAIDFAYRIQKEENDIKKVRKANQDIKKGSLFKGNIFNPFNKILKSVTDPVKLLNGYQKIQMQSVIFLIL